MDRKFANLIVLTLCSFAFVAGAQAQQQQQQQQQGSASAPIAGRAKLGVTVAEAELVAKGWRASKLIRADIYNDANDKIGRVDDFIVSPDGKLSIAVIDVGGFLGIGTRRVAVPVQQFNTLSAGRIVLPGATKDALKQLPEFQYTKG
jgi:hypothetical protein